MSAITFRQGFKYQLTRPALFEVPELFGHGQGGNSFVWFQDGRIYFSEGYAWDGASGPTWDSHASYCPSLVHDGLYQLMRENYLPHSFRDDADRILLHMCIDHGMWKIRAHTWYKSVKLFGGFALEKPKKEITSGFGKGLLWVKSDTNTLVFMDDEGTEWTFK